MKLLHAVLILCIPLVAIGALLFWNDVAKDVPAAAEGPWTRPLDERADDPFPRTLRNASGETTVIARAPSRIVSGAIFSDAVLLEICPAERILALHASSKDPRYSPVAEASARFPRHTSGAAEEIIALQPDLVIVSSFSRKETRDLIGRQGCAVLRFLGFSGVADIQSNIRALGYALGLDAGAEQLVTTMQRRLDEVARNRDRRSEWRVLHYAGFTSGRDTTFDSLLQYVGAHNAAHDLGIRGHQRLQPEQVLLIDPDALILAVDPGDEQAQISRVRAVAGFDALTAVRKGRFVTVPQAWLASTSHHAARAAERIAEVLDGWGRP